MVFVSSWSFLIVYIFVIVSSPLILPQYTNLCLDKYFRRLSMGSGLLVDGSEPDEDEEHPNPLLFRGPPIRKRPVIWYFNGVESFATEMTGRWRFSSRCWPLSSVDDYVPRDEMAETTVMASVKCATAATNFVPWINRAHQVQLGYLVDVSNVI